MITRQEYMNAKGPDWNTLEGRKFSAKKFREFYSQFIRQNACVARANKEIAKLVAMSDKLGTSFNELPLPVWVKITSFGQQDLFDAKAFTKACYPNEQTRGKVIYSCADLTCFIKVAIFNHLVSLGWTVVWERGDYIDEEYLIAPKVD